jgi:hypothetical protein
MDAGELHSCFNECGMAIIHSMKLLGGMFVAIYGQPKSSTSTITTCRAWRALRFEKKLPTAGFGRICGATPKLYRLEISRIKGASPNHICLSRVAQLIGLRLSLRMAGAASGIEII